MSRSNRRSLALEYHVNTKKLESNESFNTKTQYKTYPSSKSIKLLNMNRTNLIECEDSFIQTMLSRKSTREFIPINISLEKLAQLLSLSFGLRNDTNLGIEMRTYASAGARYPIEVYTVVLRSEDMELGIYHYNVYDNSLELIKKGDFSDQVHRFYAGQKFISDAPCIVFFSAVFKRTMEKYGERGYRFVFLDAGHMSQNFYLTAEYLGLGVVALGAGLNSDDEIDNLLGLVDNNENTIYGFAIGLPTSHDK